MRKSLRFFIVLVAALFFSSNLWSQTVALSGNVKNISNQEVVPAVSISIKGTTQGTFTDAYGNFKLSVPQLPVTLVFSSIGYETQEFTVTDETKPIQIDFLPSSALGQEVVVSA
jgi:hypothetical protein